MRPVPLRRLISGAAHVVLCTGMVAMAWSTGMWLHGRLATLALGAVALWFLALAASGRVGGGRRTRSRWRGLADLHHAVTAAAMTWMVVARPMPAHQHHAMLAAGPQPVTAPGAGSGWAGLVGGYFLLAALPWISVAAGPHRAPAAPGTARRARGMHAAGNAAMSIGMGVLLIAGG